MKHAANLTTEMLIFVPVLILFGISLLIIRSVAPALFSDQLIFGLVALTLALILSRIDYQLYSFSPWPWYIIIILLLVSTLLFGATVRGSTRWLNIFNLSIQTSELVKPLLVMFIATYLPDNYPDNIWKLVRFIVFLAVPLFLVFIQPDLGSTVVLFFICLSGTIASGIGFRTILVAIIIFFFLSPLFFLSLKPYQRDRLESFLEPGSDPQGSGYNALQAQIAVGSGKFFGRGLGQGTQSHLRFLPEKQTDFIFASVVEELGFSGGIIILAAYTFLALGLFRAAKWAPTETGSLICLTMLAAILFQAFINMGMNMGILPVTGITLPLVSAGGSSYLSLGLMLAVCLSIAKRPQLSQYPLEIR